MDPNFYTNIGPFDAATLADVINAELWQAGREATAKAKNQVFKDVASLETAGNGDLAFLDNVKYVPQFQSSKASGCIIHKKHIARAPDHMLLFVCDEPYVAYAKIAAKFYPTPPVTPGISAHAHIDETATIGKEVHIDPGAVIEANVAIGDHTHIGPNAYIAAHVTIGNDCSIGANSTISNTLMGHHVTVHRGVHIGQDGFGWAPGKTGIVKVPQLGRVIIGDHVDIGSGTCIDRGAGPDTIIGAHTKIDNLVQIGHNAQIGEHCFIAGKVGVSGSVHIGNRVMIGGGAGVSGHLTIGDDAKLAGYSATMVDIPQGQIYSGVPAMPHRERLKLEAILQQMPKKRKKEAT